MIPTKLRLQLQSARRIYKNFLWRIPSIIGIQTVKLNLSHDITLNYIRNTHVAQAIAQDSFEKKEIQLVLNELKNTNTFLNIGANTGLYSMLAKKMGCSNVYAIEPSVNNIKSMKKNMQFNELNGINIIHCGVGRTNEAITLYRDPKYPSLETHYTFVSDGKTSEDAIAIVNIHTMDQIIEKNIGQDKSALLIVIDVEGFEAEVIAGWQKLSELPLGTRVMMEITTDVEEYVINFEKSGFELIFNSSAKDGYNFRHQDGNLFFVKTEV